MRKKVFYSSLAITSIFVLISLFFTNFHPISFWGKDEADIQLWEFIIYNTFEYYGATSYMLHSITGLPTFIYYILLFLTIWVILYLIMLPLFSIFNIKKAN